MVNLTAQFVYMRLFPVCFSDLLLYMPRVPAPCHTLAPLLADNGEPTLIRYYLESDGNRDVLWYNENNTVFRFMEFASPVEFRYATSRAAYSSNWPGDSFPVGTLPAVIKLDLLQSDNDLLAVIKQRRTARHDYRDLL